MISLPIDAVIPELKKALENNSSVILSADPGAGKTTRVPISLLGEAWLANKKIIMLEPRRLAAQRAALYMSQLLGENPGETIGYRTRGESKVGKHTRIEVVTEGILTRFLQNDPTLDDFSLVIFDEFHERSIHADLGLALALYVQEHVRPELRILVMSATLNGIALESLIKDVITIKSKGQIFPVSTHYLQSIHDEPIESIVVSTTVRALREETGDVLIFLPGQREIRRVEELLKDKELPGNILVYLLFGDAPIAHQRAALTPAKTGQRKIILSTSVAETSLTIDGVRVVIDSGLARSSRFDTRKGMSGLVTTPVSQSSADQRRGRAGRQQPGVCYRLWTEQKHAQLQPFISPEILSADLAPFALELALWGTPDGAGLKFLDSPPVPNINQARTLLLQLGALDSEGKVTEHGKIISELPVHPRFAHMLIKGKDIGVGSLACDVAALLEERDLLRNSGDSDIDLYSRLYLLREGKIRDRFVVERIGIQSMRLHKMLGIKKMIVPLDRAGILLALAYPERIAKRREAEGNRYQLSGGVGAILPKGSMLSKEQYLAVGDVDGGGSEAKIFLAEPITEKDIREIFNEQITEEKEVHWDSFQEAVVARKVERLGSFILSEAQILQQNELVRQAMISGIRQMGINALPWTKHATNIKNRGVWLHSQKLISAGFPNLCDQNLINTFEEWLSPYLGNITKRSQLQQLDMNKIIDSLFSYEQHKQLNYLAPTHIIVPTGSRIPVEYCTDTQPVLAVRLQEMFGQTETPTIGGGKVKVVLHLLSPSHRPLAVTQDLPSFWKNAYPDVRKEMRGRYPKHYWPEDPLKAAPTKRIRRGL